MVTEVSMFLRTVKKVFIIMQQKDLIIIPNQSREEIPTNRFPYL